MNLPSVEQPKKKPRKKPEPKPNRERLWERNDPMPDFEGSITMTIPIVINRNYVRRKFSTDVRNMTRKQRLGFNMFMEGLRLEGVELENGTQVKNHTNAYRAFLEMVADLADAEINKAS